MRVSLLVLLSLLGLSSCSEPAVSFGSKPARTDRTPVEATGETDDKDDVPPPVEFSEADFVESERSRDPFRSYFRAFVADGTSAVRSQRSVVLEKYSIDDLKLIALVTGSAPELAMLLDPAGVGHVVKRGQFIGRASLVQPTGGVGSAYEVNWRVDRIRDGDLVLVRDDPANPDVPSVSRVIPLRTEELAVGPDGEKKDVELRSELDELKQRLAEMEDSEQKKSQAAAGDR